MVRMVRHGMGWRGRRALSSSRDAHGPFARRRRQLACHFIRPSADHVDPPRVAPQRRSPRWATSAFRRRRSLVASCSPTVGIVIPAHREPASCSPRSRACATRPTRTGGASSSTMPRRRTSERSSSRSHRRPPDRAAPPRRQRRRRPPPATPGWRHLDTDLVMFLDADDLLVPTALEGAVSQLRAAVARRSGRRRPRSVVRVPEEAERADLRGSGPGRSDDRLVDWIGYRGESARSASTPSCCAARCHRRRGGFDESLRGRRRGLGPVVPLAPPRLPLRTPTRTSSAPTVAHGRACSATSRSRTSPAAARLFDAAEQWAELDPTLVVGRGAAAPLSRARSAHERAKRPPR